MGTKKEKLTAFHRSAIAQAAEKLFTLHGVEHTTMDDIAREAQYSKATLYVYFQNKQELVDTLALASMRLLLDRMQRAAASATQFRPRYYAICQAVADYQRERPFYYDMLLGTLESDVERPGVPQVQKELYQVGEQINAAVEAVLRDGVEEGSLDTGLPALPTVFVLWSSLSGLILMAGQKEEYLKKAAGLSREQFLQYGFDTLLRALMKEE